MAYREYNYTYVVSGTTTGSTATIGVGRITLHAITKNSAPATGGVIRICDTASSTSTTANVGLIDAANDEGTYLYDVTVANGLKIDIGNATDITVSWTR